MSRLELLTPLVGDAAELAVNADRAASLEDWRQLP